MILSLNKSEAQISVIWRQSQRQDCTSPAMEVQDEFQVQDLAVNHDPWAFLVKLLTKRKKQHQHWSKTIKN